MSPIAINNIFSTDAVSFAERCLELFGVQYRGNEVYRQWCQAIHVAPGQVREVEQIPFLPISFFKSARVTTGDFDPLLVFESSGTTQMLPSHHYVKDPAIYRRSFSEAFRLFYGDPREYCILALLPSYLERGGSSLVYMVDELIKQSGHPLGGFYLHNHAALAERLEELEDRGQKTILFGVTYALLDFAETFPARLRHTIVIETGGMKGRKKEMTREEVHGTLQRYFELPAIHSEYSMTELLSQAYATEAGRFRCPPWMRILVREEDDPLAVHPQGRGVVNIIDLANVHSCAFIATDDAGVLYEDGSFEVLGRIDHSDIRGCSLLAL